MGETNSSGISIATGRGSVTPDEACELLVQGDHGNEIMVRTLRNLRRHATAKALEAARYIKGHAGRYPTQLVNIAKDIAGKGE